MMKYNTELSIPVLGENGLAETAGWLQVYNVEPITREYMQTNMEYLPVGVGLPALCYADKPELPAEGFAIVRNADGQSWETVVDYRGVTAYATYDGTPHVITFLGALPESLTLLSPATKYDAWNGNEWVTDKEAQHQAVLESAKQELNRRISEAASAITMLNDAVDLGMATETETAQLEQWKKYRVLLNRLDLSTAQDINWPEKPGV